MGSFTDRIQHAWNAFLEGPNVRTLNAIEFSGSSRRPDRTRLTRGNERSIVTAILNRIALDAAAVDIQHVRVDENGSFTEIVDDGLNDCLTLEANIDQTGRAFKQDLFLSLLDEGCVAIVPVVADMNPVKTGSYDIESMRVGKVVEWFPEAVRIELYNDLTGRREEITLPKKIVAIVENPFYAVMNEPSSTLQRLIRKMNLLDVFDEQLSSGKLDLLIQLPYTTRTELQQKRAEQRRKAIEEQLIGSRYGIAYIDSTEHITQLNRPVENNLMAQIEYLTSMLYSQLSTTKEIMEGTASEEVMNNYYSRTIEVLLTPVVDEMRRKFLTKTARTQGQSIQYFRDPFKLIPTSSIAEIADKFTRNEIMTSNEIRQIVGMKPSKDPKADKLRNKNLNQSAEAEAEDMKISEVDQQLERENQNGT